MYKFDYRRNKNGEGYVLRFLWLLRKGQSTNSVLLKKFISLLLRHYRLKYGLEISHHTKIGKGLYLGHAFNITINSGATIGDNCNLHKGIVIGRTNRGELKGVPTIGNQVWIGINAAVVGNIKIGNDVLIAPNSFVNCDVPSHSIVLGNPCIIKHRDNATEGYINNIV